MTGNRVSSWGCILSAAQRAGMMLLLIFGCAGLAQPALALPSFARQTGMSCEACHTVFPELTHFGRMFKANGYTLSSLPQVRGGVTAENGEHLSLNQLPPLSVMLQISDTSLAKPVPQGDVPGAKSQNATIGFPQQLSLFYAGKIASHLGVFSQLTYSNQGATIAIDNTDLRFADLLVLPGEHSLIYGISVNNNPTVQDLWNGVPAWGFPYAASNAAVTPLAKAAIDGNFAQDVAGASAYVFWNESLYAEAGAYRSAKQGFTNRLTGGAGPLDGTATNVIDGASPYWRAAYEQQWGRHSLEAGVYGATFKLFPGGDAPGAPVALQAPTNRFADVAEDFQYQYLGDQHIVSVIGTHIHEKETLAASFANGTSANTNDELTTTRVAATYYYRRTWGGSLMYFSTTGTTDPLLFPAGAAPGVVTSATGSPDTSGITTELNYVPWLNVKLSAQYTAYTKFNGAKVNYDGFGRSSSDNNTFYLLMWLAY